MSQVFPERTYPFLFVSLVLAYCLYYAPFGINETDGGFITGLAWQVLSGKTLYHDIIYVRPPLSVWMRAMEMSVLPDNWSILGERYFFYFKVALYTWLASDLLSKGSFRWILAMFGFVVSVHSYPACAWHTIDGILFSVVALWLYAGPHKNMQVIGWRSGFAGVFLVGALLCKQSFYPLVVAFPLVFLLWDQPLKKQRLFWFAAGFVLSIAVFINYLHQNDLLANYLQMTGSSATGGQALQHGLLDYFRIKPALVLFSAIFLGPVTWWFLKRPKTDAAYTTWGLWLSLLLGVFVFDAWNRMEFTAPFSQSRLLFLTAVAYAFRQVTIAWKQRETPAKQPFRLPHQTALLLLLLAISWSASVSWGYNLPIFLATPWVFTTIEISRTLWEAHNGKVYPKWLSVVQVILLLGIARFSYEFVYRDSLRSSMTTNLGTIFPKLQGIYSSPEKAGLYLDVKYLQERYGPVFEILPAFPQAHFLTGTAPVLPLGWVVKREMNGNNQLVINVLKEKKPVLFIQKSFAAKIQNDPELELTRHVLETGKILEETPHFWIVRYE